MVWLKNRSKIRYRIFQRSGVHRAAQGALEGAPHRLGGAPRPPAWEGGRGAHRRLHAGRQHARFCHFQF